MAASNGKDIETKAERSFDLDLVFNIEAKRTCCTASHKPFLYRKRPSQQNGERRKRNEKEDYIHVECKQLQGRLLPSPPPHPDAITGAAACASFPPPPTHTLPIAGF